MDKRAFRRELRPALYHRLHWLWPVLAHPLARFLGWALFALWVAFAVLVTVLRFVVLPNVADYQADIERAASQALGQPVSIGRLETRWRGLNPDLVLNDVRISDRQGQPAFSLNQIDAVLSWTTLLRGRLALSLLAVEGPVLHVRRETSGRISIAGIETQDDEQDPAALRWVLEQSHIRIRNATIVWEDRLRGAPPLVLEDLQFGLDNRGRKHRLGLTAVPPEALASRLDLRADLSGNLDEALAELSGKAFLQLDYADLAGWQPWLDYPVPLRQGRGAVRLWAEQQGGVSRLTADLALEDVRVRLGSELPELALASLRGRLLGSYGNEAWSLSGGKVELTTIDGLRVAPTDFHVDWRRGKDGETAGTASATTLDLTALNRLAAYLPLDEASRQSLERHRPAGRVDDLQASWRLRGETLQQYALKAAFAGLGLEAAGEIPGASGLSGRIDANEKGGQLTFDATGVHLFLPAVFPSPAIALDRLQTRAGWKVDAQGKVAVSLDKLDFAGPDATATLRGSYRYEGQGAGYIDLSGNILRADGTAVWRYMPHVVNADARAWLKRGIVTGTASDGRLVLKGNLDDFPFRDPAKGTFLITAKAHGVRIDYADGWPGIDGIDGEMRFNHGMRVETHKGRILGTELGKVVAEIPDFDAGPVTQLKVRGEVSGPTAEFLKFIEQSPVSRKIDRFTEGMSAVGNGRLDLGLELPLEKIDNSTVSGEYRFQNNQVQVVGGLPPLTQVNGRLFITDRSVHADDITARLFGGNLRLRVKNEGEKVVVQANGTATAAALREHFAWPGMEHLSGSAGWRTEIAIRKRNADFLVESDLVGISSSLPDLFNKTSATPLPLRLERSAPDATREQWKLTLGKLARGQIVLRQDGATSALERGVIAVGDAEPRLPERGLLIAASQSFIDGDAWKRALDSKPAAGKGGNGAKTAGGDTPANLTLQVRTPSLRLFGRDYHNVDVSLRPREGGWQIGLNMKEIVGDLIWRSAGDGFLEGRLKRVVVPPSANPASDGEPSLLDSLPGMNLTVDELTVGEKTLGALEVKARNAGATAGVAGVWQLDNIVLRNPDGQLKGRGQWQKGSRQSTRLEFELSSPNVGKLVERLGYGDVVRRGQASLSGNVEWASSPLSIDYPSMAGKLQVHAEKGQFNKVEPGVGKLLGLLSLQSLPRRLTLDFRDIFSDGLAFDNIDGKLSMERGVMRTTEPLLIKGPAAQIRIEGDTDLKNETQNLMVEVRPELSTAAAVGAALVNPVAGAAALVASTVLPINKLFSYHYKVSGSWSDPKVDKTDSAGHIAEPAKKESDKP